METGGYSRGKKCEGQRNDRRLNQEREGRKREGWEGGGGVHRGSDVEDGLQGKLYERAEGRQTAQKDLNNMIT